MSQTRITVLISGNGTNLQAIIDACKTGQIQNAEIVRVISNKLKAYGLERAKSADIPTAYHNLLKYEKHFLKDGKRKEDARESYFEDLASIVLRDQPHIVVCAGWMLIVTPSFLEKLASAKVAIINLHPGLPGEFNGINAIQRAYEAFQQKKISRTGIMVHYVIKEVDEGAPIITKELAFEEGETLEQVESRIHKIEWQAIVEGTRIAIENILRSGGGALND